MLFEEVDMLVIVEKTAHSLKMYKWYMKKKFAKECYCRFLLEVI